MRNACVGLCVLLAGCDPQVIESSRQIAGPPQLTGTITLASGNPVGGQGKVPLANGTVVPLNYIPGNQDGWFEGQTVDANGNYIELLGSAQRQNASLQSAPTYGFVMIRFRTFGDYLSDLPVLPLPPGYPSLPPRPPPLVQPAVNRQPPFVQTLYVPGGTILVSVR